MNQPPKQNAPPQWTRPDGVAPGTWTYVNQRAIADHYDAFVADTPLCGLDQRLLRKCLPGPPTDRRATVLDLGCGSGRSAIPMAEVGYDVIGVDLSLEMLRILREKAALMADGGGKIAAIHANLVQLDCFSDDIADHAVCLFSTLGMIQGSQNRRRMLRHVARIVRPGGQFLVHVHHRWSALREPAGAAALFRSWCRDRLRRWRRASEDRGYEFGDATYAYRGIADMFMHRFSASELCRDLRDSGFALKQLHPVSIDGTTLLPDRPLSRLSAGGFFAIARRPL